MSVSQETLETLQTELAGDTRIKVAGIDVDGILRGKIMSKTKFFSAVKNNGFGFCSVTFGWDCHDKTYEMTSAISNTENGFQDINAKVDLASFRRIPWELSSDNEKGQPFFLLTFHDADGTPIAPDPRSLLRAQTAKAKEMGYKAMAGLELEFFNFLESPATLAHKGGRDLVHLTPGNFGYSLLRTQAQAGKTYFTEIYDTAIEFGCPIEGWHTETGPGVYEAALEFSDAETIADRGSLFKFLCKSLGLKHGITPCFMAKPVSGLSGNSGHIHLSLVDTETGVNLFAQELDDESAEFKDLRNFSKLGQYFTAGILTGLRDIMPLLAPTINSYKRLIENYWAPVNVSWGLEHRLASVRLIAPPTCPPKSTRIEVRVPGADIVPHYALSALIGLGLMGIQKSLPFPCAPLGASDDTGSGAGTRLPKDLKSAVHEFMAPSSHARTVLGDAFVDHFGMTRLHECQRWEQQVTEWEVKRYMEVV